MNKLWELILPRTRKDRTSAEEQIQALKPVVYLTSDFCYASRPGQLDQLQHGTHTIRCGCIRCEPELWCQGSDDLGQRCRRQALYPGKPSAARWCRAHWQERLKKEGLPARLHAMAVSAR